MSLPVNGSFGSSKRSPVWVWESWASTLHGPDFQATGTATWRVWRSCVRSGVGLPRKSYGTPIVESLARATRPMAVVSEAAQSARTAISSPSKKSLSTRPSPRRTWPATSRWTGPAWAELVSAPRRKSLSPPSSRTLVPGAERVSTWTTPPIASLP